MLENLILTHLFHLFLFSISSRFFFSCPVKLFVCAKKKKEYGLFFPIIVILFGLARIRAEDEEEGRKFLLLLSRHLFLEFLREKERLVQMRDSSSVKCVSQSINRRRRRWVELLLAHERSFSFTSNFFFPIIYLFFSLVVQCITTIDG